MAYNLKKNYWLQFNRVEGRDVPCKPWPQQFYISAECFDMMAVEVRPLTLTGLIKGVGKNFITMNYWRLMHTLAKIGLLDTKEGQILSWSHWRWDFWNVRRDRETRKRAEFYAPLVNQDLDGRGI